MERYTIDRIEEQAWAVLEAEPGQTFAIPLSWLPARAAEGDVVAVWRKAEEPEMLLLTLKIDPAARAQRLKQAQAQHARLPRGPQGDLAL